MHEGAITSVKKVVGDMEFYITMGSHHESA